MHHFFAYMARMRYIDRWALMRNSYTENIQEHSHQVAILAHALAVLRNAYFGGQVDTGAVAVAALYHDASEILTGDLPTPIKYYNPDIKHAYKQIESVSCEKLLGLLPEELRESYRPLLHESDPGVARIVKAADKLSAYIKCVEELKAEGIISGGMIPKVECCTNAIRAGERKVFIIDGRVPHAILIEMLTNEGIGTMFTR